MTALVFLITIMGNQWSKAPNQVTIIPFLKKTEHLRTNTVSLTIANKKNCDIVPGFDDAGLGCMKQKGFILESDWSESTVMSTTCRYAFTFSQEKEDYVLTDPMTRFMDTCKECNLKVRLHPKSTLDTRRNHLANISTCLKDIKDQFRNM